MEDHAPALSGDDCRLKVLPQQEGGHQGRLVRVGPRELFPPGLRLVGGQLHPGRLAVVEEKQQVGGIVPRGAGPDELLLRVHAQFGGQIVPQHAGLGVVEVGQPGLVALLPVGEHQQLVPVDALPLEVRAVPLLVLLFRAHAQGLGGDLLKVSLPGEEHMHGIGGDLLLSGGFHLRVLPVFVDDLRAPGDGVLLFHVFQLAGDDGFDPLGGADDVLQIGDLLLQAGHLRHPFEDILLVDVAQPDVRHILRLNLVDAEADDEVGHHLGVLFRLPDDLNGPVDVQKNAL